ncbi:MAG: cupin domain-containing protein [Betaproteobacteria bacterium]
MPAAKKPAAKKAAAKKPAANKPAAKKPAIKSTAAKKPAAALPTLKVSTVTRWKPQKFMAAHASDKGQQFRKGLRSYASYRDLGISKATGGVVQAHVIRLHGPCDPKVVSIRHIHGVQFQFLYMLKGWMEGEYNGRRERFEEGACWIQPNSIPHTVLNYSDDCEMSELILPGTFETREL